MRWFALRLMALAAALFVALGGAADAQPVRLTLEDALQRAAAANPTVRASGKDIDAARAQVARSEAWVPENPYLTAGLLQSAQTGFGKNYGVSLSQEFEVAGQRSKRIAVAEAGLQKAEWDQRNGVLTLKTSVKTAFSHALLSQQRVIAAERAVELLASDEAGAEKGAGRQGDAIDRNQMLIQQARSQREVNAARASMAEAFDSLRYLIGLNGGDEIELLGASESSVRPLPSEEELVQKALQTRPDLISLQQDLDRADKQVPLVKREAIPNVTLSGNVSRFEGNTFGGGDVSLYLPVLKSHDPELQEALAERDRTQLQLEELKRSVERDVRQARRACVVAGENLELTQGVVLPRSRENLEIQRERFGRSGVGAADLIGMVIDAQYAETEYLDAVEAYNDAWIELEHAVAADL